MKIFLIGMPGSGKSTMGTQLADALLLDFIDLDKTIEQRLGKSVQQTFSENGEDYFRQIESQVLREWSGSELSFVMATGGGAPCYYNGIDVINQAGLSIFLNVPVSVLLSRLAKRTDRPLLNAPDGKEKEARLNAIHASRLACYQRASITLDNPDLSQLMEAIHLKR